MKLIRFNENGNCQFIWFNWRKLRFETTCWANNIGNLFGKSKNRKRRFIGLYEPPTINNLTD